jgi:hypothetical protein
MLTPTVAQLITEDRIREAEAWRLAEAARSPRRAAGAPRLRRPAWPFARPRTGVTAR